MTHPLRIVGSRTDRALARSFDTFCRVNGVSRRMSKFAKDFVGQIMRREVEGDGAASFGSLARAKNFSPVEIGTVLGFHDAVTELAGSVGIDRVPEVIATAYRDEIPSPAADRERKAEIERIMRSDPDRYESEGLDDEHFDIIERERGEAPAGTALPAAPGSAPTRSTTADTRMTDPGDRATRAKQLAEIRTMRREDPDRYDQDRPTQARELELIEAERLSESSNVAEDK
jgi:hypothetical protein